MKSAQLDASRPFLGLQPYREVHKSLFKGRESETDLLLGHIERSTVTVLFGRSGLGKTSLLRAGVFPMAAERGLIPILVQPDYSSTEAPILEQVASHIEATLREMGADPRDSAEETLWAYLHRTELRDSDGRRLTPLLVLDQFEELFTLGRRSVAEWHEQALAFIDSLAHLAENWIPTSVRLRAEIDDFELPADFDRPCVKIVVALREEYLAHMENLRSRIPSLGDSQMRLLPMAGHDAARAATQQGAGILPVGVAEQIVRFVAQGNQYELDSHNETTPLEDLHVEPFLLSLVCSELNEIRLADGHHEITAGSLHRSKEGILQAYYRRAMDGLGRPLRVFVEDELLTIDGFRTPAALKDALSHPDISEDDVGVLVSRKLVRTDDRLGVPHLEIVHDVLAPVIQASRDARKRSRRRRRQGFVLASGVLLLLLAAGVWVSVRSSEARRQLERFEQQTQSARLEEQKRVAEEQARLRLGQMLLEQGRVALLDDRAREAAVFLSAARLKVGERPALGLMLQEALSRLRSSVTHLGESVPPVRTVAVAPSSGQVVVGSRTGLLMLDPETAEVSRRTDDQAGPITHLMYAATGRYLLSAGLSGDVHIRDGESGETVARLPTSGTGVGTLDALGAYCLTIDLRGLARVYELTSGRKIWEQRFESAEPRAGALTRGGEGVLLTDGHGSLVEVAIAGSAEPKRCRIAVRRATRVLRSPDEKTAVVLGVAGKLSRVDLRELRQNVELVTPTRAAAQLADFLPTGELVVCDSGGGVTVFDPLGRVTATPRHADPSRVGQRGRAAVAMSVNPRGSGLAVLFSDGRHVAWELPSWHQLSIERSEGPAASAVALSANGLRLVVGDHRGGVSLVKFHRSITRLQGLEGAIEMVRFSPDGKSVLTASRDGRARLWDSTTGEALREFVHGNAGVWASSARFDASGSRVATAGGATARVWDVATGEQQWQLPEPGDDTARVSDCAFSDEAGTVVIATHSVDEKRVGGRAENRWEVWDTAESTRTRFGAAEDGIGSRIRHSFDWKLVFLAGDGRAAQGWRFRYADPGPRRQAATAMDVHPTRWEWAVGRVEGRVRVLDYTGRERYSYTPHSGRVSSLSYSQSGDLIASCGRDGTVVVFDCHARSQKLRLSGRGGGTYLHVRFALRDQIVVAGSSEGELAAWDVATGALIWSQQTFAGAVTTLVTSGDGRRWAASSGPEAAVGSLQSPELDEMRVSSLAARLASSSRPSSLESAGRAELASAWQILREATAQSEGDSSETAFVGASPSLQRLSRLVARWRAGDGDDPDSLLQLRETCRTHRGLRAVVTGLRGEVGALEYSPNGALLAAAQGDGTVSLLDVRDKVVLHSWQQPGPAWDVRFSPTGATLATRGFYRTVNLYDVASGQRRHELVHEGRVSSISFSADGTLLLAGSRDGSAYLWSVQTGELVQRLSGHSGYVESAQFADNGRFVVTESSGQLRFWSTADGSLRGGVDPAEPGASVVEACADPDGPRVVAACRDGAIRIWSIPGGESLWSLPTGEFPFSSVVFHRDEGTVLAADKGETISIVRLRDKQVLLRIPGAVASTYEHDDALRRNTSDDGSVLVRRGFRAPAHVIRLDRITGVTPLGEHSGAADTAVAVSRDGRSVATAGESGEIMIWETARLLGEPHLDRLEHAVDLTAVSRDSQYRAFGSYDGEVTLVGREGERLSLGPAPTGAGRMLFLRLSEDGSCVLRVFHAEPGNVDEWRLIATDVESNKPGDVLDVTIDSGRTVAIGPDAASFLVAAQDGSLLSLPRLGLIPRQLTRPEADVITQIVGGQSDTNTVLCLRASGKAEVMHLERMRSSLVAEGALLLAASQGGTHVSWADWNGSVRVSSLRGSAPRLDERSPSSEATVAELALGPDGRTVAIVHSDGEASVWHPSSGRGQTLASPGGRAIGNVGLAGQSRFVFGTVGSSEVSIWSTKSGKLLASSRKFREPIVCVWQTRRGLVAVGRRGGLDVWPIEVESGPAVRVESEFPPILVQSAARGR